METSKLLENFNKKIDKKSINDCWEWQGYKDQWGYGVISGGPLHKRLGQSKCHRLAYLLHYGSIDKNLVIRHLCGNAACCNPHHLKQGTVAENNADMVKHGTSAKGIKNPKSKLCDNDVREIRNRYSVGESLDSITKDYPVGKGTIRFIINKTTWKHVV